MHDFDNLPDFIPDDIEAAYVEEARQSVSARRGVAWRGEAWRRTWFAKVTSMNADDGRGPAVREQEPVVQEREITVFVAAALVGFLGAFAMTAFWAWLALSTPHVIWWWLMAAGAVLTVFAALALSRAMVRAVKVVPAQARVVERSPEWVGVREGQF